MSAQRILDRDELAKVKPALAKLLRPSIQLTATPTDDAKIARGASKLGGAPDLPKGTPWPTSTLPLPRKHGKVVLEYPKQRELPADATIALPFVAQIALAELARKTTLLPKRGLLSFFYDNLGWGERTGTRMKYHAFQHPARVRVLHTPDTKNLARLAVPDAVPLTLASAAYTKPTLEQTLPDFESCWFRHPHPHSDPKRQLALTAAQRSAYVQGTYDHRANRQTHMLLGHADYLQPFGLERGYAISHDFLFFEEPKLPKQGPGPVREMQDSQLLLQVSSPAFGRGGRLCFFIRNADLAVAGFSRVWVCEQ